MFQFRLYIFLCLPLIFLPLPAAAGDQLTQIKDSGILRVCIWPGYFAISYRNPRTGQLSGIDIDMAHALASHLNVKLQFVESSFSMLIKNMEANICDIAMHGVGIRDDRKERLSFSEPYLASGIYAVASIHNEFIRDWSDIDQAGNIVAVQKGTYMEPVAKQYFTKAKISIVDSFKAREQAVQSGRADVFLTDFPYGKRMTVLTDWAALYAPPRLLAPTFYAYAVPKGKTEWLNEVNQFLTKMKTNGMLERYAKTYGLSEIVILK